jgi:hypothetical protein
MSLTAKITKAVDTAFNKVGDLAKTVTLQITASQSYNFGTNEKTETTTSTDVLAIVLYADQDITSESIANPVKEVLVKESDLPDPKSYDKVVIDSQSHTIISFKVEPGLVTLMVAEA